MEMGDGGRRGALVTEVQSSKGTSLTGRDHCDDGKHARGRNTVKEVLRKGVLPVPETPGVQFTGRDCTLETLLRDKEL